MHELHLGLLAHHLGQDVPEDVQGGVRPLPAHIDQHPERLRAALHVIQPALQRDALPGGGEGGVYQEKLAFLGQDGLRFQARPQGLPVAPGQGKLGQAFQGRFLGVGVKVHFPQKPPQGLGPGVWGPVGAQHAPQPEAEGAAPEIGKGFQGDGAPGDCPHFPLVAGYPVVEAVKLHPQGFPGFLGHRVLQGELGPPGLDGAGWGEVGGRLGLEAQFLQQGAWG